MNETNEESIVNRIIPIETIFKVAEYIEDVKDEFSRLDDIENYISQDEVQIGKFTDNGMKRLKIEKIYKVTKIIVLMQLAISIVLFLIIK